MWWWFCIIILDCIHNYFWPLGMSFCNWWPARHVYQWSSWAMASTYWNISKHIDSTIWSVWWKSLRTNLSTIVNILFDRLGSKFLVRILCYLVRLKTSKWSKIFHSTWCLSIHRELGPAYTHIKSRTSWWALNDYIIILVYGKWRWSNNSSSFICASRKPLIIRTKLSSCISSEIKTRLILSS